VSVRLVAWCPAKVNLALKVIDRRADGYHELDTVFQAIDLWDRLEIQPAPELTFSCDDAKLPTDERNLVVQAARRIRDLANESASGAALHLSKSIPLQAGLGGGSSDAAGALMLCARYWGVSLDGEGMHRLAGELGADVPFFLAGGTARGRGRGDRIEPLPFIGDIEMVLGLPPFGIATHEVFAGVRTRLTLPRNGVSLPAVTAHKWPGDNDFSFAANDLERVVFPRWPELRRFRDALLEEGARGALLSGSGSTVYGLLPGTVGPERVVERLTERFPDWTILLTRTVEGGARVEASAEDNRGD
jgi:4-diphosphocytidyl-2-C-methyl-D-erythritol kinase